MGKKKVTVELNKEELIFLDGMLEAAKCKLELLESNIKQKKTVQKEEKMIERLGSKLAAYVLSN